MSLPTTRMRKKSSGRTNDIPFGIAMAAPSSGRNNPPPPRMMAPTSGRVDTTKPPRRIGRGMLTAQTGRAVRGRVCVVVVVAFVDFLIVFFPLKMFLRKTKITTDAVDTFWSTPTC